CVPNLEGDVVFAEPARLSLDFLSEIRAHCRTTGAEDEPLRALKPVACLELGHGVSDIGVNNLLIPLALIGRVLAAAQPRVDINALLCLPAHAIQPARFGLAILAGERHAHPFEINRIQLGEWEELRHRAHRRSVLARYRGE